VTKRQNSLSHLRSQAYDHRAFGSRSVTAILSVRPGTTGLSRSASDRRNASELILPCGGTRGRFPLWRCLSRTASAHSLRSSSRRPRTGATAFGHLIGRAKALSWTSISPFQCAPTTEPTSCLTAWPCGPSHASLRLKSLLLTSGSSLVSLTLNLADATNPSPPDIALHLFETLAALRCSFSWCFALQRPRAALLNVGFEVAIGAGQPRLMGGLIR